MYLTCPSCGFKTIGDSNYGSYAICPVCDWEDDPVQLANPTSAGGANKISLAESQENIMADYPLNVNQVKGFERDTGWRPLSDREILEADRKKILQHWHTKSVDSSNDVYWMK